MKKTLTFILATAAICLAASAQVKDPVRMVNTLQGTDSCIELSRGNTFPNTVMPHGVHAWSPKTGFNGTGQKYYYSMDEIRGFDQTHQCNSWMNDYCSFSLMPETGKLVTGEKERGAKFSHSRETGMPHYYCVTFDNGIKTEIAPTERAAHLRFSFPSKGDAFLVLDASIDESSLLIDPQACRISGWVKNMPFGEPGFNAAKSHLREYIILQFDKPFAEWGFWDAESISKGESFRESKGQGLWIKFRRGTKVQVKAAGSFISPEQAQFNYDTEIAADKNLEATAKRGEAVWNELLGKIAIKGGTEEQQRTFYSCLFRASCFPRMFYEFREDGTPYYMSPFDGKVHDGYMYADNGHWDSFRSHMPLNILLFPTYQGRYAQSLLDAQSQKGTFPSWSAPGECGVMIGNHGITVLADAWAKGLRTFNPEQALKAYMHEVTATSKLHGTSEGRNEYKDYFTLGFIPFRSTFGATAKTLEYSFDDWCGYKLASDTGNDFYAGIFERQVYNYRNVFDKRDNFMKGRLADGTFDPTFTQYRWGSLFAPGDYVEGNAWHWTWSVFHDIQGLINLFGSDEAFVAKLDSVFTQPLDVDFSEYGEMQHEMAEMIIGDMGQYAHGNQPIQHMPYLYNYAGQPWKSQYWLRQIMNRLYGSGADGYPGDEDQGSTSAWYVWSALGLFPVTPGIPEYVIGSPMFENQSISLENGKVFTIKAEGNSDKNVYIQEAFLNGDKLDRNYITHDEVVSGGELRLVMGDQPNLSRGISKEAAPYSYSK